jgi:hypothetical protein
MKRVITTLITLLLPLTLFSQIPGSFIEQCATSAGEDATYLKDFVVTLNETQPNERQPVARYPLVLSKNNIYRFSVCTAPGSEGKAIIELYESNKLIYSSYIKQTGEENNPFNFLCSKTGIYHVFISFLDGKKGEAVGILSYVTR